MNPFSIICIVCLYTQEREQGSNAGIRHQATRPATIRIADRGDRKHEFTGKHFYLGGRKKKYKMRSGTPGLIMHHWQILSGIFSVLDLLASPFLKPTEPAQF